MLETIRCRSERGEESPDFIWTAMIGCLRTERLRRHVVTSLYWWT